MVQYGLTAGGGAAAGVAGKTLSDGLSGALGKSADATGKAAGTTGATTYVARPAIPDFDSEQPITRSKTSPARAVQSRRNSRSAAAVVALPVAPPRPQYQTSYSLKLWAPEGISVEAPTAERIAQIKNGENIEDLGGKLGVPANLVVIPGTDGRLWQRVKYKNQGRDVGVIYVADGKVVEVLAAVR